MSRTAALDRTRVRTLLEAEEARFVAEHPRSSELADRARLSLFAGVPMPWMSAWVGPFPIFVREAMGSRLVDVDGHEYVDLCLGDTGAMAGHAPEPTIAALSAQARRGLTTMLPTEDAIIVGEEFQRRFGLPYWSLTLSATDANRNVIRIARHVTGRRKVLVFNYAYHGTVDETLVTLRDGQVRPKAWSLGPPGGSEEASDVIEFNDVDSLERALAGGEVACVLAEPVMTNIGIVLPEPGYHDALRELTSRHGALLAIDETHTFSAGWSGYTGLYDLSPDLFVIGKAIAGGFPAGAYGMTEEVARRVLDSRPGPLRGPSGLGGTLAGNALSVAAIRATLMEVLTEETFASMAGRCARFTAAVETAIADFDLPWHIVRLGGRAEYRFRPDPPRCGGEAALAVDEELDRLMHLFALNRGVLLTPFHIMALMSPAATDEDVDRHTAVFRAAATALTDAPRVQG
jgi:glutamate-1-semialdehyde 2,1-aminomutase